MLRGPQNLPSAPASAGAGQAVATAPAFAPGARPRLAVPSDVSNDPYPVKLVFLNGARALKQMGGPNYLGGFFIGLASLPDDFEPPEGFEANEHTFSDATKMGYMGLSATVSILLVRRRWEIPNGRDITYLPWQSQVKGITGVRGNIQALVYVKGANYPMVMSFNGMTLGNSLDEITKAGDALAQKANTLLPANGFAWPKFMFGIPVISQASIDPVKGFVEAKGKSGDSSWVTPLIVHPSLAQIDVRTITDITLSKFYIGDEAFEKCQTWIEEAMKIGWHTAWNAAPAPSNDAGQPG